MKRWIDYITRQYISRLLYRGTRVFLEISYFIRAGGAMTKNRSSALFALISLLLGSALLTGCSGGGSGSSSGTGGTDAAATPTISLNYTQGDMVGKTEFYTQMSQSVANTSGALLQAILAVNSFLFTDCKATDLETFKSRKLEADKALDTLAKYAEETETLIAVSSPKQVAAIALSPDEVLATVSSGPSNKQIKTLMTTYKVNAKAAKEILDSAMSGLISSYDKEADFYNKAALTANLVKESSGLALTIAGTVVTAGGVSGALAATDAACAIISGADGVIKVTKSGLELAIGKEITIPDGSKASMIMTSVSTVSDIIAFKDMGKLLTDSLTTAENVGNVYTISSKIVDGFTDKTITLGGLKVDISDGLSIGSSVDVGYINSAIGGMLDAPSTMPGTYKVNGVQKVVSTMPETMNKALNVLPAADKVDQVKIADNATTPIVPTIAGSTTSYGSCTLTETVPFFETWSCTNYSGSLYKGDPAYIDAEKALCNSLVSVPNTTATWSSYGCPAGAVGKCTFDQSSTSFDGSYEVFYYGNYSTTFSFDTVSLPICLGTSSTYTTSY